MEYLRYHSNIAKHVKGNTFINNCNLCLSETSFIKRNLDDVNMLNNRSEFISKCWHKNKWLLNRVKDDSNDWLWCVFVLTVCFLHYLWNLFVFVGKNIDWRLPSMKLAVSIMLYWIPSQSSLYLYLSVYLSICLSVCLSVCLSISLSLYV